MGKFWDERAREEPYFFVDNRRAYGDSDLARFWSEGESDLDRILGLLGVSVAATDVALDIGCGVGRLTRVLAQRASEVVGIDVSGVMLERARIHHAELSNMRWIQGDGVSLTPVDTATIDVVVSHVVFQHIPDPQITLGYVREIARVLRDGGWAAFQCSTDPGVHLRRRPRHALRERLAVAAGRRPGGQDNPAWLGSSVEMSQLRRTAAESGLTLERVLGEGTQFCLVLARRRGPAADPDQPSHNSSGS
jgi:SAM-dependent methyltransferase